jgi:hypothetical protein
MKRLACALMFLLAIPAAASAQHEHHGGSTEKLGTVHL